MDGVNLSGSFALGYDEPDTTTMVSPFYDRVYTFVYAIDPTQVSFASATVNTIASGTELYKCGNWDFAARACFGNWVKTMDTIPGVEYNLTLTPNDPGFAEMIPTTGVSLPMSISDLKVFGSIPAPIYTNPNYWGAVVFNPTNRVINITKVRFIASLSVVGAITGANPGSGWTSNASDVNWTGNVMLSPNDSMEFIVNVTGTNANNLNTFVSVNVTTNDTNFSTGGYITYGTATATAMQYPAVFFLNSSLRPTLVKKGILPNVSSNYTVRINNSGASAMAAGAMLVLYMPPGWDNIVAAGQAGWDKSINGDPGVGWIINPDTNAAIGGPGRADYTFNATPPDLDATYVYSSFGLLLAPSAGATRTVFSLFVPGYQVLNISPGLLYADDNRYAVTRTIGGARSPGVFFSVPSPAGRAGGNMWGAVVVNPSDTAITVTELNWSASAAVFADTRGGVTPATTWALNTTSRVRWNGTVTVRPHGTAEFIVSINGSSALLSASVNVSVNTSIGVLNATGFPTDTRNAAAQYPSLYAFNSTIATYTYDNIVPSVPFNITLRVNNTGGASTVPANTMLEVYVPAGWNNLAVTTSTGWTVRNVGNDPAGPNIIRATNNAVIAVGGTRDLSFNATPPTPGTNSSYRLDAWFIGESGTVAAVMIQSSAQICLNVVPPVLGINITRKSAPATNISNISTLTIVDIAKAETPTAFNFSLFNVRTGNYETIKAAALGTAEEGWNATITINSSSDPRNYVNDTVGSPDYGKILVRWYTGSGNNTALYEDWLYYNTTFHLDTNATVQAPSTNIVLNAGSVRFLYCNATVSDNDGNGSIRNVSATIYLNGTSPTAVDSNVTHYTNSSCLTTNVNGTAINATCGFTVLYYAANGTWLCNVTVNDSYNFVSSTSTFTIDPLWALNLTSPEMNFTASVGGVSANLTQNVSNIGNQIINVSVYGYGKVFNDNWAFVCPVTNISIGLLKFAGNITANYTDKLNLTGSAATAKQIGIVIATQTNPNIKLNQTYWQVYIPPPHNSSEICNGTIVFQAELS